MFVARISKRNVTVCRCHFSHSNKYRNELNNPSRINNEENIANEIIKYTLLNLYEPRKLYRNIIQKFEENINMESMLAIISEIIRLRPNDYPKFINNLYNFPIPANIFNKCNPNRLFVKICYDKTVYSYDPRVTSYTHFGYKFSEHGGTYKIKKFNPVIENFGGFHFCDYYNVNYWIHAMCYKKNQHSNTDFKYRVHKVIIPDDENNYVSLGEHGQYKAAKIEITCATYNYTHYCPEFYIKDNVISFR